MASNKRVAAPAAFALALLLLAYCAEAYVCTTRNGFYHGRCVFYHGRCVSNRNCAHACIAEGVGTGGYCSKRRHRATGAAADSKWLFRRPVSVCKCTVPCKGNQTPPAGGGGGGGGGDAGSGGDDPPTGGSQQQPPIAGGQPAPFAMPRTTTRVSN